MNEYYENFIRQWNASGGLIPKAEASRILRKSDGRISQMISEGKLKAIGKYVSFSEVCKIAEEEERNKGKND